MSKESKQQVKKLIKLAEEVIPDVDIFGCSANNTNQMGEKYISIRFTSLNTPLQKDFIQKIIKYADLFENRTYQISQTRYNNIDYNLVADIDIYSAID